MIDHGPKDTGRIEAFSDGVFAIAITLLGLELKVPLLQGPVSATDLATSLGRHWPSYMAFVSSFITILIMWMHHHRIFTLIRVADSWVMFLNGALLLLVTAVPFSTALVAAYYLTPAASVACAVYAAMFVLISIAFNALWVSVAGHRLLRADVSAATARAIGRGLLLGPPLYLAASGIAFANTHVSMAVLFLLWVYWAAIGRVAV